MDVRELEVLPQQPGQLAFFISCAHGLCSTREPSMPKQRRPASFRIGRKITVRVVRGPHKADPKRWYWRADFCITPSCW